MGLPTLSDLQPEWQEALQKAVAIRERAYAPYSNFLVGATILTDAGEFISGANVENASYSLSLCAERSAAVSAIAQGAKTFSLVAITARHRDYDLDAPVSPCGACRQFLYEFKPDDGMFVLLADSNLQNVQITSIDDLLPGGFKF